MTAADQDMRAAEEAARWYARIHADNADDRDRAAFRRWRLAEPANGRAWSAISRAEDGLALAGDDPAIQAMIAAARSSRTAPAPRIWQPFAAAAAVLLVAGVTTGLTMRPTPAGEKVAKVAAGGTLRAMRLPDGSTMTLDAGGRAAVFAPADTRRVTVEAGRAMFAVAKDAGHPFVVSAAGNTVTALGTHFSVETTPTRFTVALVEGSVRVVHAGAAHLLLPGDVLTVAGGRTSVRHGVADVETGWQRGVLNFDAMPLGQVVGELNRYAGQRVILKGDLAERPFSGVLRTRDGAQSLAAALEAYGTARIVERTDDRIVLAP